MTRSDDTDQDAKPRRAGATKLASGRDEWAQLLAEDDDDDESPVESDAMTPDPTAQHRDLRRSDQEMDRVMAESRARAGERKHVDDSLDFVPSASGSFGGIRVSDASSRRSPDHEMARLMGTADASEGDAGDAGEIDYVDTGELVVSAPTRPAVLVASLIALVAVLGFFVWIGTADPTAPTGRPARIAADREPAAMPPADDSPQPRRKTGVVSARRGAPDVRDTGVARDPSVIADAEPNGAAAVPAPPGQVAPEPAPPGQIVPEEVDPRRVPPGTGAAAAHAFEKLPVGRGDRPPVGGIGETGIHVDRIAVGGGYADARCQAVRDTFSLAEAKRVNVCFRVVHPRERDELSIVWEKSGGASRRGNVTIKPMHAFRTRAYLVLRSEYEGPWTVRVFSEDGVELANHSFTVTP